MSFRIEEKFPINTTQSIFFLKGLQNQGLETLYPRRKIESIYFDNHGRQIFTDSVEGSLPIKKIRIRKYPEQEDNIYNLEIKISSLEGRFKTSKQLTNSERLEIYTNGYFDYQYGLIFPVCKVSYFREYYEIREARITLDTSIEYSSIGTNPTIKNEPMRVLELKAPYHTNMDFLNQLVPVPRRRFSKYCNAIKLLNNINL